MKKLSFVYLPILFFVYIATETILKLNHSTLCESTGCKLADTLLKFDSIYINFMGLFDAVIILVLGWLSYKRVVNKKLFYVVLFASLTFESVLLGYQFFVSPEMCKFCMGIYSFLIIMMILSSQKYFITVLPVVISIWISLSFLAMPKSKSFVVKDGNYLIQSPTCKHCKKVKEYLKEQNISFSKLEIDDIEARNFATFLNFNTIPILIIKNDKDIKVINGDNNIIRYLEESKRENGTQGLVVEENIAVERSSTDGLLYENVEEDEGCGFVSITKLGEESDCNK